MLHDVHTLLTVPMHEPAGQAMQGEQRHWYRIGYDYALLVALKVMNLAYEADQTVRRERRDAARRRMRAYRERRERFRLLVTRRCTWRGSDDSDFCRAPARWMMADTDNRPIDLRCNAHRAPGCEPLPTVRDDRL